MAAVARRAGISVSVATFRRYVRKHARAVRPEDVTVRKPPTPPARWLRWTTDAWACGSIRTRARATPAGIHDDLEPQPACVRGAGAQL